MDLLGSAGNELVSYEGWDNLNISNVTVLPWDGPNEIDFVARQTVHVQNEFHVLPGNEVHIYTAETFPDCDEENYADLLVIQDGANSMLNPKASLTEQKIELKFVSTDRPSQVYPNPFTSELNIEFGNDTGNEQVELFDGLGRVVESWNGNTAKLSLNIGEQEPGPYLLRIINGQTTEVFTVIKQP